MRTTLGKLSELLNWSQGLAVAWSSVLLFDLLVFLLTGARAFRVWRAGRIVHVVLRDGIMYFWWACPMNHDFFD